MILLTVSVQLLDTGAQTCFKSTR